MKKRLRQAAYITIGVVVLILLSSLLLPTTMEVEQSQRIDAPVALVFQQVNDLRNWDHWAPWRKEVPGMELSYSNPPAGKDAYFVWRSDRKRVGNGKMTVTEVVPQKRIEGVFSYDDWKGGTMRFTFEALGDDKTQVTCKATNEIGMNPFTKYAVLISFKREANHMFRRGLDDLRQYCEDAQ